MAEQKKPSSRIGLDGFLLNFGPEYRCLCEPMNCNVQGGYGNHS